MSPFAYLPIGAPTTRRGVDQPPQQSISPQTVLYPGGMTEISRWLSASDTTGSDARKETSSTPAGVAGEARGRTALRIGRRKRRIQRMLVSDFRPSGNPRRHSCWHHLRDAKRFDETVIRWCRRVAPQPPAYLCHPSGIKRKTRPSRDLVMSVQVLSSGSPTSDRSFSSVNLLSIGGPTTRRGVGRLPQQSISPQTCFIPEG